MAYLETWPETIYPVRAIEFSPNTQVSFILAMWEKQCIVYSSEQDGAVSEFEIPYLAEELKDISYDYKVDFLYLAHPNHEPRIIKYTGDSKNPLVLSKLQEEATWKAPPFLKEDTSGVELVVSDEVHYVKLVGNENNTFSSLPLDLNANARYIELRINNKWAIYRLVDKNVDSNVPSNPTSKVCYAEPVRSVVESLPDSARFALIQNTYLDKATRLSSGERELRSDTLVFNYDLEGAYARVPLDYGVYSPDSRLRQLWSSGVETPTGDDNFVWVQFLEYVGQDDFSTSLWEGNAGTNASDRVSKNDFWEVGHIYKIRKANGFSITVGAVKKTSGGNRGDVDWEVAYTYQTDGDTFALENVWRVDNGGSVSTRIADMSKAQTFDIMKTGKPLTLYRPPDEAEITFDDDASFHTARLSASDDIFDQDDVGRYLMVKYDTSWTTYRITEVLSPSQVNVNVLDNIPISNEKGEYELNGRSSIWRKSAWSNGNWPFTVTFYEQRMTFGGSVFNPETLWFSKVTDPYDFRTIEENGEVLDTTGITYPLGGRSYNKIKWLSSGPTLMIGTESTEWQLKPNNFREALTPTNIRITQETNEGSLSFVIRAGSSLVFPERTGEFVRELVYNYQIDQFEARDLTLLADHLFRNDAVVDFAYQRTPKKTFWFVTLSGLVYLLAHNNQQEVLAWSRFQTRVGDKVLSVAVMERNANNPNDRVYLMIQRNGEIYVEYIEDVYYEEASNLKPGMNFLDCSSRFEVDSKTTVFTGLERFNNTEVSVVVDGAYVGEILITEGTLNLEDIKDDLFATQTVLVGYNYISRYVSNPLSMQVDGGANYGKRGRLIKLGGYFYQTLGFKFGIYGQDLRPVEFRDLEGSVMDQSPPLFTGFLEDELFDNKFDLENQIVLEQDQPYPLTVMCLLPES